LILRSYASVQAGEKSCRPVAQARENAHAAVEAAMVEARRRCALTRISGEGRGL
jgi:hypothetical protein